MDRRMKKSFVTVLVLIGVLSLSPFLVVKDGALVSSLPNVTAPENPYSLFQIADGPTRTGVLNAIEYAQTGTNTETTGVTFARTDETPSVDCDLTLDTTNGWTSNQIEVNVTNLRKLLALNGTFSTGYPGVNEEPSGAVSYYPLGWGADSVNDEPTKQTLRARYNDSGSKHIELELEGEDDGYPDYKVFKNSEIYWYQDIVRSPSEDDFLLSFDLLYDSGPIGTTHINDFQLRIEADSTVLWSMNPVTFPARDIWSHIGPIPGSLASVPTSFELRFVFEILESRTLEGDRVDFGGDVNNARFLRFYVDDISLTSADYYDPDDANMKVDVAPVGFTSITGSNGNGQVLVNHSFWETSPVSLSITSDEPVSFEYEGRFMQEFRRGNTSWTTDPSETGIGYSVDIDESPVLTTYFYVPNHDHLEDFVLELPHASDYENASILDASSTDVTTSCSLSDDLILISGSILDSLGWWKVTLEAPNYALTLKTQEYQMPLWENRTRFESGDQIRAFAEIGTQTSTPAILENVSVQWFQPNATMWSEAIINDGVDGIVLSPSLILGPFNATPGEWTSILFWNNGSELAYSETSFEIFHSSTSTPVESYLDAESDSIVTCAIQIRDADTNEFLLDEQTTVVGNWTTETITFQRNLAKSWWEGDLNTSLVGRGNFTILVNASRPYYQSSNCTVMIEVTSPAIFSHLGQDYVDVTPGSNYDALFRYSYPDDVGIEGAIIEVVSVTGPVDGLSYGGTLAIPGQPGNYSIDFQVDIDGSYSIDVRASKIDHNTETISFNIVASGIATEIYLLNGSSDAVNIAADYQLAVHYRNSTGEGLSGAIIEIIDVVPVTGLDFSPSQFHGNGTYTILIDAQHVGVYSITVRASLTGYETQLAIFTLVVSPLSSILSVDPVVYSISVDSNYTLLATFSNMTHHGLENASISVISIDPPTGLWISEAIDLGSGVYSLNLIPSVEGTYNLVLNGALENYQNSTTLFTLVVTEVATDIQTSDGQVSGFTYFTDTFDVLLVYERSDNLELVTGATIEISAVAGLEYIVVETPQGYLLTINPSVLGRWSLSILASKAHYRNVSMIFDFEVLETVTVLTGNGLESSLYFGVSYDFRLSFADNESIGILNATINPTYRGIQGNPILWVDNNNGSYSFTLVAGEPGSYQVSIEFSKYGYAIAEGSFSFDILAVPTDVVSSSLPDSFYGSRIYSVDIYVSSNQHGALEDAEVIYSNSLYPFILSESFENGWYNITFSPNIGNFSEAVILIEKDGFIDAVVEFPFFVSSIPFRIPSEYMLNSTYSLLQGHNLELSLYLTAEDTGEQLSDAIVSYLILETGTSATFVNHTDGTYSATIPVPVEAGTYNLKITIEKNQFLDMEIDIILISEVDSEALVMGYVTTSIEAAFLILGVGSVVYVGRRRQKRIARQRRIEILRYRERFNDVSNIIAFLVIHRSKGLPIYSRIIKGGFEMSMISGFITAISNFSEEIRTEEKLWAAIPISEVVTAVHTNQLICTLITVDAPSPALIENLEQVSTKLGLNFDSKPELVNAMSSRVQIALDNKVPIDDIFDEYFDTSLLFDYSSYDISKSSRYSLIAKAINSPEFHSPFSAIELVAYLVSTGLDERLAYTQVIDAIEADFLLKIAS